MTYRLAIQPRAELEIETIAESILDLTKSVRLAVDWMDKIQANIETLTTFPHRCPVDPESIAFGTEVRIMLHGKKGSRYRILFVIVADEVRIISVQHASRPRPLDDTDLLLNDI